MKKIIIVISLLLTVLLLTGCEEYTTNQSESSKTYQISINNSLFSPNNIAIKIGDTITWTNFDNSIQTITPDINDDLENNVLAKSQSFTYTFYKSGTYKYHSKYNKNMTGIVIVE